MQARGWGFLLFVCGCSQFGVQKDLRCEPEETAPSCDENVLVSCDPEQGFLTRLDCTRVFSGGVCDDSQSTATCAVGPGCGNGLVDDDTLCFGAPQIIEQVGNDPGSLKVADVDRDGLLDLVFINQFANAGTNTLRVFFGNGDGSFDTSLPPLSPTDGPSEVEVIDLTHDGLLDLVVANQAQGAGASDSLNIFQNNGDRTFRFIDIFIEQDNQPLVCDETNSFLSLGIDVNPTSMAFGDLSGPLGSDRDGLLDLVIAEENDPELKVLFGRVFEDQIGPNVVPDVGVPCFQGFTTLNIGNQPSFVTLVFLNNDDALDIVASNENNISIFTGDTDVNGIPDGTFTQQPDLAAVSDFVVVKDINQDGRKDIISDSTEDVIRVFIQDVNEIFTLNKEIEIQDSLLLSLIGEDINKDGKIDLITTDQNSDSVFVILREANDFGAPQPISVGPGTGPSSVGVGDFNRDGLLDIVTTNALGASLTLLLSDP